MEKPVIQTQLRRTARGRSWLFEALLDGKVVDTRSSQAHEFHGALLAQGGGGEWNRLSYHSTPAKLAVALRRAQQKLKWPVQYLVATVPAS